MIHGAVLRPWLPEGAALPRGDGGPQELRRRARDPVPALRQARRGARRERALLAELKRRGIENGLRGLSEVDADAIRELEPNAAGIRALHVPETGIIDYHRVALPMQTKFGRAAPTSCSEAGLRRPRAPQRGRPSSSAAIRFSRERRRLRGAVIRTASPRSPAATAQRTGSSRSAATTTRSCPRRVRSSTG